MDGFFRDLDNSINKGRLLATESLHEFIDQLNLTKKKVVKLAESIRYGFFILDQSWRFVYLNQHAEQLFQRRRNDLLGKVMWEEFPQASDTIYEKYRQAFAEQVDVHFEAICSALGNWMEVHVHPFPEGVLVFFQDATRKQEKEEYARLAEDIVYFTSNAVVTGLIDGVITSWNPGAENMYGYKAGEAIGQHIKFLASPEQYAATDDMIERVSRGETITSQYAVHHNRAGEALHISLSVFPLRDMTGQISRYTAIMNNISDEIKRGQELQHFFDLSADIMVITDLQGRILRVNQAFEKTLGWAVDEVVGQLIIKFVAAEDRNKAIEYNRYCIDRHLSLQVYEIHYSHRDGSKRLFQWNAVPVPELGCYYAIARDIEEQRKLEQKLIRSNRRNARILESIRDGFFVLDREWKITYVNRVASDVSGFSAGNLIGRKIWDIFPNTEETTVYRQFHRALESQMPIGFECWVNALQGWFEFNVYPTSDGGLLAYFYNLSTVIHARQQLQRLESMQLVNEMAAGISHEVRNPLTAVRGFLQVLRENRDFIDYGEYFDVMLSELDRANLIITEFLNLAKDRPAPLSAININQIIERMQPLIEVAVSSLGHELVLELTEVADILVNENDIRQLILNLVRNGAEAMTQRQGRVKIATHMKGEEVVLAVRDEGSGIPPEYMEKIGTPFFTTKESGSGLGLATCFSITKRNGARIEFDSVPQEGTEVKVSFHTRGLAYR